MRKSGTAITSNMHPERQIQQENLRRFMKTGKKIRSPSYTLKASKMRILQMAKLFRKAYEKEAVVAWRSPFVPTEIFYALDIIPLCIEAFSSMLAGSLLSAKTLDSADDAFYSRDVCSFLRCAVGAAREDYLPTPDFLVCTSHYCDSGGKTFDNLAKKYKKPYFFLDTPYHYNDKVAVDYLAKQLEDMVKELEKIIGRKMNPDKLAETIKLSNEAREYFLKVNELRKNIPSPMLGSEAIDYAAIVANTWGTRETIDVYKTLYEELKERVEKQVDAVEGEQYRILWRHLRPYYDIGIMSYLENQCKMAIAFEEINYIYWKEMDPKDPYRSLSQKLLSNSPIGPIEHWTKEATLNFVNWYKIDGIIEFAHWGCRHLNSAAHILRDELQKIGKPFLVLDGDCIDDRNYAVAQTSARIDAFLNSLENQIAVIK